MKRKAVSATPNTVAADPTRWSDSSQGSVAAYFTTAYVDVTYRCWHCRAEATFTAADQKYTYEVRKANINQSRLLCVSCWKESVRIADGLAAKRSEWAASKKTLKDDRGFLSEWLHLVETTGDLRSIQT